MVPSVFTRIIAGDFPGRFVWRDERCVAFLSINPLAAGHTLVVPRSEVDHWLDLEEATNDHIHRVARAIGAAQMLAFKPTRVGLIVAGFEVPHVHVHVIPTMTMANLDFSNAAANPDPDELDNAARRLREALTTLGRSEVSK